ncbi:MULTISPECIES: YqaA family protein [unclassified Shinella]|uniref:YqaA family protein n=1 Tax=unclassified Shinella TaxID=2643062 RepID=UPI00225D4CD3|nr:MULTISPECIES: YqaA family protein [unclassified Shinella]MCO5140693.1 DedA family protein [Shinella sp.]MDC7256617.1 DedA family protein [Shinella sp. YE25]CAI0339494.1 putative Inner membrane protein YqaA [Rhizobiaceae bacterium]CAK7257892.1 DedA family protein [Shinella sp. WSC3-e]
MSTLAAYGGLFLAALVAATILPAQSEAVLGGLLATGTYSPVLLILVAGTGNILGSVVNWLLGRGVERFRGSRWFPVSDGHLDRAGRWYRRYGWWSLLFSWMPVIGDPLTVAAGIMREPFLRFLVVVSIAKFGRYIVLAALVLHWL